MHFVLTEFASFPRILKRLLCMRNMLFFVSAKHLLVTMHQTPVIDGIVAVGMVQTGMSYSHVARQYAVDRHTVARWHLRHLRQRL